MNPAITLIVTPMIVVPNRYEIRAWRVIVRRMSRLVDVRVADLVGHPDREADVGEVAVVGWLVAGEVDAARLAVVVQVGVAQHVHGVHRRPRQHDGGDGDGREQHLLRHGRPAGP